MDNRKCITCAWQYHADTGLTSEDVPEWVKLAVLQGFICDLCDEDGIVNGGLCIKAGLDSDQQEVHDGDYIYTITDHFGAPMYLLMRADCADLFERIYTHVGEDVWELDAHKLNKNLSELYTRLADCLGLPLRSEMTDIHEFD